MPSLSSLPYTTVHKQIGTVSHCKAYFEYLYLIFIKTALFHKSVFYLQQVQNIEKMIKDFKHTLTLHCSDLFLHLQWDVLYSVTSG